MRFFWIITLFAFNDIDWVKQSQLIILLQSLIEGFRRAQWSLIRIENENVNNFERYRNILQIPAFKDEEEDGVDDNKSEEENK